MTSMIDDIMTSMSKILFENVTKIMMFQMRLKKDCATNMDKMVCHYIQNVIKNKF